MEDPLLDKEPVVAVENKTDRLARYFISTFYMILFITSLVNIYRIDCRIVRSCYMDETMSEGEVIELFHKCFTSPIDTPICTSGQQRLYYNDYFNAFLSPVIIFILFLL